MQVQQILGQDWYFANSNEKFILVSKEKPNNYEELSMKIELNAKNEPHKDINLYGTHSNEYVYIFQNQPFKISGVYEIATFELKEYTDSTVQLLIGRDNNYTYFYIFKAPLDNDSIPESISVTHLGTVENVLFPIPYEFPLKDKVSFYYENGYYYLDYRTLFFGYITNVLEPFSFFRFNDRRFETFMVDKGYNLNINFSKNGKIDTIVCPKGIFDVHSFEYFEIESLINELPRIHTVYYYRLFSISERKRILFVSETYNNFSTTHVGTKEYKFVDGLLYDLTNNRFVLPKVKYVFRRFLLYDYGMPHIFLSETKNGTYLNILSISQKTDKFCRFYASKICSSFSMFDKKNTRKKSILFVEALKNNISRSSMMVFDENLHLELIETDAKLQSILCVHPCSFSNANNSENKTSSCVAAEKNSFYSDTSYITDVSYSLGLIVNTPRGKFGESVYLPISDTTHLDYNASFFNHQVLTIASSFDIASGKNSYYLKVICRRNDFENHTYIINLNTGYSALDNSLINSIADIF